MSVLLPFSRPKRLLSDTSKRTMTDDGGDGPMSLELPRLFPEPEMTRVRCSVANLDAVEWLRTLPSASVDLVVTDPPYESLEKHRAIGTTTRLKHSKASSNDWFSIFPNSRFPEFFAEAYRVLAKN